MTTLRFSLILASILAAAGCSRAHGIDPILVPDAGSSVSLGDAGRRPSRDAGIRVDAGDRACEPLTLLDEEPIHFDAVGRLGEPDVQQVGALTVASDGETAWIGHLHGNPSPCDGACLGLESLGATGGLGGFVPLYWLPSLSGYDGGLRVVAHPDGAALAWGSGRTWDDAEMEYVEGFAWQRLPRGEEPWSADGTGSLEDGERAASLAPLAGGGVAVLLAGEGDADGRVELHRVLELDRDGSLRGERDAGPLVVDFEVLDARLVPSRGLPWLVTLEDWDFPPTVQVRRIDGTDGEIRGSSCGVRGFDARELDGGRVAIAQRCEGGALELDSRPSPAGPTQVIEGGLADVEPALAVLEPGREVVVAYVREGDPAPTVERFWIGGEFEWTSAGARTLPLDPDMALPVEAVALDVLDDGTIAVAWHGRSEGDFSGSAGAVARVRACDP